MDKITRAIDLARQARNRHVGGNRGARPENISYTQSRQFSLDRQHMRAVKVIAGIDDHRVIDAYKLLRTRVMTRMQQNNWTTLGITSAAENEGKSLTSINLAISIALKLDHTALLVDTDFRRPSVHKLLGMDPEYGITDHLLNDIPIPDILVHPGIERLVILPGRSGVHESSELLSSTRMISLVNEIKTRYPSRLVLFDLPPVLVGDDVVAFAPHLDAILLVVEDGMTDSESLKRSLEVLENVNVIGAVLNRSRDAQDSSYSGYY